MIFVWFQFAVMKSFLCQINVPNFIAFAVVVRKVTEVAQLGGSGKGKEGEVFCVVLSMQGILKEHSLGRSFYVQNQWSFTHLSPPPPQHQIPDKILCAGLFRRIYAGFLLKI